MTPSSRERQASGFEKRRDIERFCTQVSECRLDLSGIDSGASDFDSVGGLRTRCFRALERTVCFRSRRPTCFTTDFNVEGLCLSNPKAKRDYSLDSRPDCKHVVVGLVLDAQGFLRAHEIFAGNRSDPTQLRSVDIVFGSQDVKRSYEVTVPENRRLFLRWGPTEERPALHAQCPKPLLVNSPVAP